MKGLWGNTIADGGRISRLANGGNPAYGLWSTIADLTIAEMLAVSGHDFVVVDTQHGQVAVCDLPRIMQAYRAGGRAPLVRVPSNDPDQIMRAADAGASGVIVPMIESAAQAAEVVAALRFPPAGTRSWDPMWASVYPPVPSPREQDEAVLVAVMVETRTGLDAVEAIAETPGLDAIFIGPNDLALSCGFGRATYREEPEVDRGIRRIVAACQQAGILVGMYCSDKAMAQEWAGRGVHWLSIGSDAGLIQDSINQDWLQGSIGASVPMDPARQAI